MIKSKNFLSPLVAGIRLSQLAIEHVFCSPAKVKWSISITYEVDKGFASRHFQSGPPGEMEMIGEEGEMENHV